MICLLIALLKGYNLVALPPAKIIPFIYKKTFAGAKVLQKIHIRKYLRQNLHIYVYFLSNESQKHDYQGGKHQYRHLFVQFGGMGP